MDSQKTGVNEVIHHMTADNRPDQKSTPRTYFVSEDAADAMGRSLPLLTFKRQCWVCQQEFDLAQVIVANPQEFISTIADHCSLEPDYLLPDTPMKEAIFRTLLAHRNDPMDVEQISEFLGNKWVMTPFPRNTSPRVIWRLLELGDSGYYCIASSDSEYSRESKNQKPDKTSSSKTQKTGRNRGTKNDSGQPSQDDEERRSQSSAPVEKSADKPEETEAGETPVAPGTEKEDILSQPQDNRGETGKGDSGNDIGGLDPDDDASANAGALKPFESVFFDALTVTPSNAPDRPDILPQGGPKTSESAEMDTRQGVMVGRTGAHVVKEVTRWQPTEAAKDLADKFRAMVLSDYGSRCQVCRSTFQDVSGNFHTSVIHIVPPIKDTRTNNLGNLMGLCGRHYEYIRHGEWAMLDPETEEPFQSPEEIRDYFLNASQEIDDNGNSHISVPVRFSKLYLDGSESPTSEHGTIKYSIPHWEYLCELFGRSDR